MLLGGTYVNGIILSLEEEKERNLGDSFSKLKHTFQDSSEHWGEKLFIFNSRTEHCFNFDLAVVLSDSSLAISAR